jgi:N-acetylneuraminate synthase/N,N'-diacetyllegionaminate synthase
LQLFGKNLEHEVAVVAEIGVNHEGDEDKAAEIIRAAATAGADAVKLQTYTPARFASAADPVRFARATRFCLSNAAHRRLAEVAAGCGVILFSSAVTEDVIPFLADLFPVIKIASGDLNFEVLVRSAVATGHPVILSTGNSTIEEIDTTVGWCRDMLGAALPERLALLHCVSAYPAPVEEANVESVPFLKHRYGLTTGYSNHVIGAEAVLAAVALGAQIVEVHVTDCKTGREFRDHSLSFEADELARLVASVRAVKASLGKRGKTVQPSEAPNRAAMRKGVVAARDLSAGTILGDQDLMYARPATEFEASEQPLLMGKTLTVPVRQGELIARAGVQPPARTRRE